MVVKLGTEGYRVRIVIHIEKNIGIGRVELAEKIIWKEENLEGICKNKSLKEIIIPVNYVELEELIYKLIIFNHGLSMYRKDLAWIIVELYVLIVIIISPLGSLCLKKLRHGAI